MATPGSYAAPIRTSSPGTLRLAGMGAPVKPNGTYERMAALTQRMEKLRPRLAAAAADESRRLQNVAVKELGGQKRQIERYIVEARLAAARIYDRTRAAGSAAPGAAPAPSDSGSNWLPGKR